MPDYGKCKTRSNDATHRKFYALERMIHFERYFFDFPFDNHIFERKKIFRYVKQNMIAYIQKINTFFKDHRSANIFLFVVLIITVSLQSIILVSKSDIFVRNYHLQYEDLKNMYYNSQYVKKNNPGIIPDEKVYAFGGGIFLKGLNPILITHDHPPLGRYIISLSILLFDNASTIPVFLIFFSAIGIFFISQDIFKNKFMSLIPTGIFMNEPLFLTKIHFSPLLETIQLPFIIFGIFFFIKGVSEKKFGRWVFLTSVMLGFVISTRFFIPGLFMVFSFISYFILNKNFFSKRIIIFFVYLPISLLILIASYIRTIQSGYTIWQVFGIQKYIFYYQSSKLILPFSFWDLLFFNKWHTWWGDMRILSDSNWIILWPISFLLSFLLLVFFLFKHEKMLTGEKIILLWIIFYMVMLSAGTATTRFFLPLSPFFYILAVSCIKRIYSIVTKKKRSARIKTL